MTIVKCFIRAANIGEETVNDSVRPHRSTASSMLKYGLSPIYILHFISYIDGVFSSVRHKKFYGFSGLYLYVHRGQTIASQCVCAGGGCIRACFFFPLNGIRLTKSL